MGRGAYDRTRVSTLLFASEQEEDTQQEEEQCLEAEILTSEMHSARHVVTISNRIKITLSTRVVSSGVVDLDSGAKPIV
jgi:hypothetical protein